jgi:hypothetical protein
MCRLRVSKVILDEDKDPIQELPALKIGDEVRLRQQKY